VRGQSSIDEWAVTGRRAWPRGTLSVVLALVAASAVYGGVGLIANGIGMPSEWLRSTPFSSWLLPGIALLVTVALPQLAAAGLIAVGHRWAALAGVLAGAGLVLWIVVQVLLMRRYFFLQPVIAATGVVEMLLARRWTVRDHRPVG
jgi:sterol desaturase/sphingolipid hydroxylase (fatty acid hydroxylase superfamily)